MTNIIKGRITFTDDRYHLTRIIPNDFTGGIAELLELQCLEPMEKVKLLCAAKDNALSRLVWLSVIKTLMTEAGIMVRSGMRKNGMSDSAFADDCISEMNSAYRAVNLTHELVNLAERGGGHFYNELDLSSSALKTIRFLILERREKLDYDGEYSTLQHEIDAHVYLFCGSVINYLADDGDIYGCNEVFLWFNKLYWYHLPSNQIGGAVLHPSRETVGSHLLYQGGADFGLRVLSKIINHEQ